MPTPPERVEILPIRGLPEVRAGDDLAVLLAGAGLRDGDIVVVSQKVVSKAEGAVASPAPGEDPARARRRLAAEQARRILCDVPAALVVATRHGLVCANAGIDASNVPDGQLTLLPHDPDESAARLRAALASAAGVDVGVLIADTFGRPWRLGQTDVAIGAAGVAVLRDERGTPDRHGRTLEATVVAVADELAAAADLVRRKDDGTAAAIVRGMPAPADTSAVASDRAGPGHPDRPVGAAALVRELADDLFAHGRGWLTAALAGPVPPAERPGRPTPQEWRLIRAAVADRAELVPGLEGVVVTPRGHDAAALVACGEAAATVRAALLDLGYAAAVTVVLAED